MALTEMSIKYSSVTPTPIKRLAALKAMCGIPFTYCDIVMTVTCPRPYPKARKVTLVKEVRLLAM